MSEEFNKLKEIRDLCSNESWNIGYLDERVDTDYDIYLGRAELADSILKIIGTEMHKKLGDVKWEDDDERV